jgi:hypothetical protein
MIMPKPVVTAIREETPVEQATREWFEKQSLASPDSLNEAARQIITVVTTLLGILLGILALASHPLPTYLRLPVIRGLGIGVVVLLLLSLAVALIVTHPLRWQVNPNRPVEQIRTFQRILRIKSIGLGIAATLFWLGLVGLGSVIIIAIYNV